MDRDIDPAKKPSELVKETSRFLVEFLEGLNLEERGEPETLTLNGIEALRLRRKFTKDDVPCSLDAFLAARAGKGLLILVVGNDKEWEGYQENVKLILDSLRLAGSAAASKTVSTDHYTIEPPDRWSAKEVDQNGTKALVLSPPGKEGAS